MAPFKRLRTYQGNKEKGNISSETAFNDLLARNLTKRLEETKSFCEPFETTFDKLLKGKSYNNIVLKKFPQNCISNFESSCSTYNDSKIDSNISERNNITKENTRHKECSGNLENLKRINESSVNSHKFVRSPIVTRNLSKNRSYIQNGSISDKHKSHEVEQNSVKEKYMKSLSLEPSESFLQSHDGIGSKCTEGNGSTHTEESSENHSHTNGYSFFAKAVDKGSTPMNFFDRRTKDRRKNYSKLVTSTTNNFSEEDREINKVPSVNNSRNTIFICPLNRHKKLLPLEGNLDHTNACSTQTTTEWTTSIHYSNEKDFPLYKSVDLCKSSNANICHKNNTLEKNSHISVVDSIHKNDTNINVDQALSNSENTNQHSILITSTPMRKYSSSIQFKQCDSRKPPSNESYKIIDKWNYLCPSAESFNVKKRKKSSNTSEIILKKFLERNRSKIGDEKLIKKPVVLVNNIPNLCGFLGSVIRKHFNSRKNGSALKSSHKFTNRVKKKRKRLSKPVHSKIYENLIKKNPIVILERVNLESESFNTNQHTSSICSNSHTCSKDCECFNRKPKVLLTRLGSLLHDVLSENYSESDAVIDIKSSSDDTFVKTSVHTSDESINHANVKDCYVNLDSLDNDRRLKSLCKSYVNNITKSIEYINEEGVKENDSLKNLLKDSHVRLNQLNAENVYTAKKKNDKESIYNDSHLEVIVVDDSDDNCEDSLDKEDNFISNDNSANVGDGFVHENSKVTRRKHNKNSSLSYTKHDDGETSSEDCFIVESSFLSKEQFVSLEPRGRLKRTELSDFEATNSSFNGQVKNNSLRKNIKKSISERPSKSQNAIADSPSSHMKRVTISNERKTKLFMREEKNVNDNSLPEIDEDDIIESSSNVSCNGQARRNLQLSNDVSQMLRTSKFHITIADDSKTSYEKRSPILNAQKSRSSMPKNYIADASFVENEDGDIIDSSLCVIPSKKFISVLPGKKFRRSMSILKSNFARALDVSDSQAASQEIVKARTSVRVVAVSPLKKRLSVLEKYAVINSSYASNQETELEDISTILPGFVKGNNSSELIEPENTAENIVLRRCGQTEPLSFEQCYPTSLLRHCQKIGEGVYGEVFLLRDRDGSTTVMKIIPIEGNQIVNLEKQKTFQGIMTELIVSIELSNLRKNKLNYTNSFTEVKRVRCVKGCYPDRLLELWELYDENKGSENDSPEVFLEEQLYISLELSNGGRDLEAYHFKNAQQALAVFQQVICALAVAECELQFEHRDLHWGNILISDTMEKESVFIFDGKEITIDNRYVKATIIDFTFSRVEHDGVILFDDLATDEDLFTADGDYQFEIYRLMRKNNENDWQTFKPYTNILWLHYVLDKAILGFHYKNTRSKLHKSSLAVLKLYKEEILDYNSAYNFVLKHFLNV